MTTMLKIRSSVFSAIHSYFRDLDFIEYQAPNFVAGAVEGVSTLFEVPYFGRKAYLTQSWQLYAEAAMPALERLYTIAPSFRAEKSRTRRHLTEFWHAEMEVAWASNDDIMKHGEKLVRNISSKLLDERSEELESVGRDLEKISMFADTPYPRMKYDEAIEILHTKKADSVIAVTRVFDQHPARIKKIDKNAQNVANNRNKEATHRTYVAKIANI